jgi:hypothetical protein
MTPQEAFAWVVIYSVCLTLLVLHLREERLRKSGK